MNLLPPAPEPSRFAPTRWTVVLRARGDSDEGRRALAQLCESYWNPVFRFVRGQGRGDDDARDLTQEFFARLLARGSLENVQPGRGRFRSYLLGAVKHFLADQRDHERREKRGGGLVPESLDGVPGHDTAPALQVPDPAALPSDGVFDRAWALAVMAQALETLRQEHADAGKAEHFEVLKPWLEGDADRLPQEQAAARLNLNEGALKVAIHRLRKRFRELIRRELAETVDSPAEVEDELRYLVEVLAQP